MMDPDSFFTDYLISKITMDDDEESMTEAVGTVAAKVVKKRKRIMPEENEVVPEGETPVRTATEHLDLWFQEHVPNSKYSRNTEVYNRIYHAVAAIKEALSSVKE